MRTTIELPNKLVNDALSLSNVKTKKAVITIALEDFVRKQKIHEIKQFKGKINLNLDLDALRKR
ncbi:MAG: type II toxin-antitoxin system VapB family antitoxin [Kiritimatiellae bacterium]|jgi:Arc/MetJ family transcription regulator|nr:type II toxin-antitoxin system VapB family antitoxin [Kiritimatiellia bacterium]